MNYFTPIYFLVLLPLTVFLYSILPQRHRWKVLLLASYAFFWLISRKLIVYLLFSTLSIHHIGLWLENIKLDRTAAVQQAERSERKAIKAKYAAMQRGVVAFGVALHIGLLLLLKYSAFFSTNFNALLGLLHAPITLPVPKFALPIGISFYTMQAASYLFDVYRDVIPADRNLGRLALYMSFFPSLMEGPISRYSDTAQQLYSGQQVNWHNFTFGIQRILYGFAKKLVVADRLDVLVKEVFTNYANYDGGIIALAMVCYTCELYMDFSGTMDVVIGSGEIFGVKLPENFRQPFFSKSISEFWTRWHITLGTWFRDYIFYPLSLSKPLKRLTSNARKKLGNHFGPLCASSIALFCVWFCNGLWHGAAWSYIFFGMYHFVLILLASITEPYSQKLLTTMHIQRDAWPWHTWRVLRTVVLVNIGELFFRATTLTSGMQMFRTMVTNFTLASFRNGTVGKLGLDKFDLMIAVFTTLLVLVFSILHERGISLRNAVAAKPIVVRWCLYLLLLFFVVIFGAYGLNYTPVDPLYAGF